MLNYSESDILDESLSHRESEYVSTDPPNQVLQPSHKMPKQLLTGFNKSKTVETENMGMFSELSVEEETQALHSTTDYAQHGLWASVLANVPFLKSILTFMARSVRVETGGLTHRGKKSYTLESIGIYYCIFWIVLIVADINLLAPVINNKINRIGTDQIQLSPAEMINPSIL